MALAAARVSAAPATKAAKPTEAVNPTGCVTAECHAGVKAYKSVHAPVTMNACDACHTATDVKAHTFTVKRQNADLCTYCHEFSVEGIPVIHSPVAKGECLGCHNPHGGVDRHLVRENSMAEMCARCHENIAQGRKNLHDPVAKGNCDSCHTSHASRFPKLLYAEGDALCLSCHADFQAQLEEVRFPHAALKEGCGKCHEAHASDFPKHLRQPIAELCTSCHEGVKKDATQSKFRHTVVLKDRACMTCHTAHGSDLAALMADQPLKVCMTCHGEKVKTDRGYVVAAMPELSDPKTFKHGPVADGECGSCHETHGSSQPLLLVRSNAGALYQSLAAENYRLCFGCHDIRLGQEERTASATNFRNGDENLHYLHANRGNNGTRGRNCRICHSTHASHSPQHVNDVVQFGMWQMPIRFQKTDTGGTCSPGCHLPYPYDRVRPATRPTSGPAATRPATPMVVAGGLDRPISTVEKPDRIAWSLTATTDAAIKVPNPNRPMVLLFTRVGQSQQPQLVRLVRGVVRDGRRAQVVMILGGEGAKDEARRMIDSKEVTWPVVVDAGDEFFNRLQVHVWPTVLVVADDGTQIARIAGAPESLGVSLAAYLEFAARRIDRTELARRLAVQVAVGETPARKASRQLQIARRMAAENNIDQARRVLTDSLAELPDSVPLRLELVRVLTQMGKTAQALNVLDELAPGSLPPAQAEVLRARVLMDRNEWTAARSVLATALQQDPQSPDAHYLRGRVYEYDGDWPKAAQEYRAARELGEKQ